MNSRFLATFILLLTNAALFNLAAIAHENPSLRAADLQPTAPKPVQAISTQKDKQKTISETDTTPRSIPQQPINVHRTPSCQVQGEAIRCNIMQI